MTIMYLQTAKFIYILAEGSIWKSTLPDFYPTMFLAIL